MGQFVPIVDLTSRLWRLCDHLVAEDGEQVESVAEGQAGATQPIQVHRWSYWRLVMAFPPG